MSYLYIFGFSWCLFFWCLGLWDIQFDMLRDKDLNKAFEETDLHPVVKNIGYFLVAFLYVFCAPINKPRWWIAKEMSKRRVRRYAQNIKDTLDEAGVEAPEIRQNLDEVVEAVSRQKDKDW